MISLANHIKRIYHSSPEGAIFRIFLDKLFFFHEFFKLYPHEIRLKLKAVFMGIPQTGFDYDSQFGKYTKGLSSRGINFPLTNNDNKRLHIVYASFPSIWEEINIPPQIEKIGKLSKYYTSERNIDISNRSEARDVIDNDFYNWINDLHEKDPIGFIITYFSGAEISSKTIKKIKLLNIPIATFHWDDRLHFYGRKVGNQYSGPVSVCREYDLNLTNSTKALVKYHALGANAIFWPEAANPDHFKPVDEGFMYDVSFVGAKYGTRSRLISFLRENGIIVSTFGPGWSEGKLTSEEMVRLYSRSRINLGFGYIGSTSSQCLKGRDFEVPSCGALYLTSHHADLDKVYRVGVEIMTYNSFQDCLNKINDLLNNPDRCNSIRKNARERVLADHTWEKRIESIIS